MNNLLKNNPGYLKSGILYLLLLLIQSCKSTSPTEFATQWSNEIKTKIMEDANQAPDKTVVDTIHHETTTFKKGKVLKHFYFTVRVDKEENETKLFDTAKIIYYSADQNFQFIQTSCSQNQESSIETVAYKGDSYGLITYVFCHAKNKQTGFQFKNLNVATWTTYDSTGKNITQQIDVGNAEQLKKLEDFKYSRDTNK